MIRLLGYVGVSSLVRTTIASHEDVYAIVSSLRLDSSVGRALP